MSKRSHGSPSIDVRRYVGQWVALHPDTNQVIGSGRTIEAAGRQASKRGVKAPVYFWVPKHDGYFVGGAGL